MKRLYIMEKEMTAIAVAEALGVTEKRRGYYVCGEDTVTWCIGHMLQLCDPEDYDPAYAKWDAEHLPLVFIPWKYKPIPSKADKLQQILSLIEQAETIVNGGDMDDEGQLLIEEVIEYAGTKKSIERILLNDLSPRQVTKAIEGIEDNALHFGTYQKALARSVGDQLYGYNLTRAYTLAGREAGIKGVLSVGRVQTAILGMIVRKDRLHEAHQGEGYFSLSGNFEVSGVALSAQLKPGQGAPLDDKGRIADGGWAKAVAGACQGKPATVGSVDIEDIETPAPLPFNLLNLQAECAKRFKMNPARKQWSEIKSATVDIDLLPNTLP